ncbi:MAG: PhzF family phenazine biosynthesis protein [Actinomycetota bacterium]
MQRAFRQIDVFSSGPLSGNPLAVVLDGDGLGTDEMQRFANWTNLSETTFVVPTSSPEADYGVRIFTPASELPFAGHPTLGTCHAWLEAGGAPKRPDVVVQECGAGLVPLRRVDTGLAFAAPPLVRSGPVGDEDRAMVLRVLRLDEADVVELAWIDNGPGWIGVLLADADAVLALDPDLGAEPRYDIGVVGPHGAGGPADLELRAFFREGGTAFEDPVTGSLNASVAQWLIETGRASAPYTARQGTAIGRAGRIEVTADADGTIWVGGASTTHVEGTVTL